MRITIKIGAPGTPWASSRDSERGTVMERVPQVLENVTLPARRPLDEMPRLKRLSDEVSGVLGDDGRLLVRWSGTEAKLRIMLEGPDEGRIRAWARELAQAAREDVPEPAGRQ